MTDISENETKVEYKSVVDAIAKVFNPGDDNRLTAWQFSPSGILMRVGGEQRFGTIPDEFLDQAPKLPDEPSRQYYPVYVYQREEDIDFISKLFNGRIVWQYNNKR